MNKFIDQNFGYIIDYLKDFKIDILFMITYKYIVMNTEGSKYIRKHAVILLHKNNIGILQVIIQQI